MSNSESFKKKYDLHTAPEGESIARSTERQSGEISRPPEHDSSSVAPDNTLHGGDDVPEKLSYKEEQDRWREVMESIIPEKVSVTINGQKVIFLYEGKSGYPQYTFVCDVLIDEMNNYLNKEGLKRMRISAEDRAKLVSLVKAELEARIKKPDKHAFDEELVLISRCFDDSSLDSLANEYIDREYSNNETRQELISWLDANYSRPAPSEPRDRNTMDPVEHIFDRSNNNTLPNYDRIRNFIQEDIPKDNIENLIFLYTATLRDYASLLHKIRKELRTFEKAQKLRKKLGREPLSSSAIQEEDNLRDQLHKKLEELANSLGRNKTDVWLDILDQADGNLSDYGLPNIIIRSHVWEELEGQEYLEQHEQLEQNETVLLFGYADTAGQSGENLWYRFADKIGQQRIYVHKNYWQRKLEGATKVFAFQRYLAEKYPTMFQVFTEEDYESHGVAVDVGVKIKTDQVEGAAAIIRSEIAEFT